ncbi:MAG: glutamate--tRNA ligase [Tepidisphaeraceae bacterium]
MTVTSRFAPSPTGYLHVGGARTALFSWLLARHQVESGRFLLRIEDTDLARSTEQATTQLQEDLRWLGLHWDNPELVYQSKRKGVYNAIIDSLLAKGLAYKAYDTREELDALRKAAEKEKRQFIYRRRECSDEELARFASEGRPHVVRFVMPAKEYRFHDAVLDKEVILPANEAQDFVIRKEDGMPTYHFAVVVDDAEMGITHILRGQEHIKNTFLHIALQDALEYVRPIYGHLSVIMNLDGSKMGKRDRDKKIRETTKNFLKDPMNSVDALAAACGFAMSRLEAWLKDSKSQLDLPEQRAVMDAIGLKESDLPEILVHDFRRNGYLPEALLNFLALVGWNPGGDRERMTMEEMVQLFEISGIGKSNAKFDRAKLLAFNTEALAAATPERLLAAAKDFLSVNLDSPLTKASDEQLTKILEMKKGLRLLREAEEASRFLFVSDDELVYNNDAIEQVLRKNDRQGALALKEVRDVLAGLPDWTTPALEQAVQQYCEGKHLGLGKVAQPMRVAVSGSTVSPPIFQSLEFLGRIGALARIDRCLLLAV